jgi:hypothetical protein
MPHALFLGRHLATVDRLDIAPRPPTTREKPFLVRGFSGRELWRVVPERWRPLGGQRSFVLSSVGGRSCIRDTPLSKEKTWRRRCLPEDKIKRIRLWMRRLSI